MFDQIETYARDRATGEPGWSIIMDPNVCPPEALNWLAQFVGVPLDSAIAVADQRAMIIGEQSFKRGTPAAMKAAVQRLLTGTKSLYFQERAGDPYKLLVATLPEETPESDQTLMNFVTNPNFENGLTTSWAAYYVSGTTPIAVDPATAYLGTKSLKVSPPGAVVSEGVGVAINIPPMSVGQKFTGSFYLKGDAGSVGKSLYLVLGAGNGNEAVLASDPLTLNWKRYSLTFTATATQASMTQLYLTARTLTQWAGNFWIDAAMLTYGTRLFTYFDGDFGANYTGTYQASTSIKNPTTTLILDELLKQKPAGIMLTVTTVAGGDYNTFNASHSSYHQVASLYANYPEILANPTK